MVERGKHVRNAGIVVALALAFWLIPGGGTAANAIGNLLSILFLAGLMFFGYRLYMEHRMSLFSLPGRLRALLYACGGVAVLTVVATGRMWEAGGGLILLWFALLGAVSYGVFHVFRSSREY